MLKYIRRNFEKPENGLLQVIIAQGLVFLGLRVIHILEKFTGVCNLEKVSSYIQLTPDHIYTKPWTLVTYSFIHHNISPLLFNLLWLYTFGRVIVYLLGSKKFLTVYFLGAVAGGITFVLAYNLLPFFIEIKQQALQNNTTLQLIGSSAALYATIAGLTTFAPNFSLSIHPVFEVKIKYIAFAFLVWPILSLSYTQSEEGVNVARLGGALIGYLYIQYLLLRNKNNYYNPVKKIVYYVKRSYASLLKKPTNKPKKEHQSMPSQKEIDAILDKIALHGYGKLSQEEKRKLFHGAEKKQKKHPEQDS